MFIRIKSIGRDSRFKISSINSFNVDGQSPNTKMWYITIKISGKEIKFAWLSEEEMRNVEKYLDKALKVEEV